MFFWTKDEYQEFADAMMDKPISFYASIAGDLGKKKYLLQKQNSNLCKTCDILIPTLINGNIDVSNLPIRVKED